MELIDRHRDRHQNLSNYIDLVKKNRS